MSKPTLGIIDYHPFGEIPEQSVSFTVDEDMREIVPRDYKKTKEFRRNRAKQIMGAEAFNKLEEQNKELELDKEEELRQKRIEHYRKLLAELEKKELKKKLSSWRLSVCLCSRS